MGGTRRPAGLRRLPLRTALALTAVTLTLASSACRSEANPPATDRGALETYQQQTPGVPIVLPTTLPSSYVFLGPGFQGGRDGALSLRTMDFQLDGEASKVIEICTTTPDTPAGACNPPDSQAQTLSRTQGAYPVWIRPLGTDQLTDEERALWSDVPLSDDLDAITWLS